MPKSHLPTEEQIQYAKTVVADSRRPTVHKKAAKLRLSGMAVRHIAKKLGHPISTVHYWLNPVVQEYQKAKATAYYEELCRRTGRVKRKSDLQAEIARARKQRADGMSIVEIAHRNGWSIRTALRRANPETHRKDNERSRLDMAKRRKDATFAAKQRNAKAQGALKLRREAGVESVEKRKKRYEESIPDLIRDAHDGAISLVGKLSNTVRGRVGKFRCEICGMVSKNRILLASILQGYGIQCDCEKYGYDKLRNIFLDNQLNLSEPCQFYVYRTSVSGYMKPGISIDHRVRARHILSQQLYRTYVAHWHMPDRRHAIVLEQAVLRTFADSRKCPEALCGLAGNTEVIKVSSSKLVSVAKRLVRSMRKASSWAQWALDFVPSLTDNEVRELGRLARRESQRGRTS